MRWLDSEQFVAVLTQALAGQTGVCACSRAYAEMAAPTKATRMANTAPTRMESEAAPEHVPQDHWPTTVTPVLRMLDETKQLCWSPGGHARNRLGKWTQRARQQARTAVDDPVGLAITLLAIEEDLVDLLGESRVRVWCCACYLSQHPHALVACETHVPLRRVARNSDGGRVSNVVAGPAEWPQRCECKWPRTLVRTGRTQDSRSGASARPRTWSRRQAAPEG